MSDVFVPPVHTVTIKGEEIVVKDPSLQKVLLLLREARPVLSKLMTTDQLGTGDTLGNLAELAADPEVFHGFCLCASACTSKPVEFFAGEDNDGVSLGEAATLLDKMRTAVNWKVLKELFQKILPVVAGPPTMSLQNLQETSTP